MPGMALKSCVLSSFGPNFPVEIVAFDQKIFCQPEDSYHEMIGLCSYLLMWWQLALIFTTPGAEQDNVMIAVMLLAGCLSYSNSAMNPVLYAFLSENFKKSFMKACQCAAGQEVNAALQVRSCFKNPIYVLESRDPSCTPVQSFESYCILIFC